MSDDDEHLTNWKKIVKMTLKANQIYTELNPGIIDYNFYIWKHLFPNL